MEKINKNVDITKYNILDEKYKILKKKFQNICYAVENDGIGNLCFLIENFFPKKIHLVDFFDYLIYISLEAISISKKYNKYTYNSHVYCKNCSMSNISIKKFTVLNDTIGEIFSDRLNLCFLYVKSKIFNIVFPLVYKLLDKETQNKIRIINQKK